jgi:Zn finger protein HypA/HybF involved in hydrogenase expression
VEKLGVNLGIISIKISIMHDFLLAKEIVDEVLAIATEKNIEQIKSVSLEIGGASIPHNHQHEHEHDEHFDELNLENVQFGIENIAKKTILKDTKFKITKVDGNNWKITNISI